ncbi:MAG: hypothetical protein WBA25_04175 [Jannaschia sp.]
MRTILAALLIAALPSATFAVGETHAPLRLQDAAGLVGAAVLTSDDVRLGHLIAFRETGDGGLSCVIRLHRDLRVRISALMVDGLHLGADGTLRVSDDAAMLAERLNQPLLRR